MKFYLGTHKPRWLWWHPGPFFVSARRLRECVRLRPSKGRWALDSGGFTEIGKHGRWTVPPRKYAMEAVRWQFYIGRLDFATPQDWMCEKEMLAKTGLTVQEHQTLTLDSFLTLRGLAPSVPWIPVLQGYTLTEYLYHFRQYEMAGVNLLELPLVGLGSVCRRQAMDEAARVVTELHALGLKLHAFGFKMNGIARVGHLLASSDSMAWSRQARWEEPLPGCAHPNCANCHRYAEQWRGRVLGVAEGGGP
jgi:hypothetical protein